jgi:hypothetical protein
MSYKLCTAPDGREFYMVGNKMFSHLGYSQQFSDDQKVAVSYKAVGYKDYSGWRDMADDMEKAGIANIFTPFSTDFG